MKNITYIFLCLLAVAGAHAVAVKNHGGIKVFWVALCLFLIFIGFGVGIGFLSDFIKTKKSLMKNLWVAGSFLAIVAIIVLFCDVYVWNK